MTTFGEFIKAKKAAEAKATVPFRQTRPAAYQSRVVILRKRADGEIEERTAAPAFLRQDPKALVERINLPADYYWRDSPAHLARKAELEEGAD